MTMTTEQKIEKLINCYNQIKTSPNMIGSNARFIDFIPVNFQINNDDRNFLNSVPIESLKEADIICAKFCQKLEITTPSEDGYYPKSGYNPNAPLFLTMIDSPPQ